MPDPESKENPPESEQTPEQQAEKDRQQGKIAGARDYIGKLDTREAQNEAVQKHKDNPELYDALLNSFLNEDGTPAFQDERKQVVKPPEQTEESPEETEEVPEVKQIDEDEVAQKAAGILKAETQEKQIHELLIKKGVKGEENFAKREQAAKALVGQGFDIEAAVNGATAASNNPVAPSFAPGGSGKRGDEDDFDNKAFNEFNQEQLDQGLSPVSKEAFLSVQG